ncbi:MAG TPA: MlaD family protein [Longimicrobiales bacterium]|nr:MlaD family protein [Longimicrobiales bacterium]
MSIRANPTVIGLFLIGAIVLAVGGTAALASTAWFQKRTTFVSFFQETVNGLDRGAPVKFQGVPVGTVTEILIQIDERDKTFQVPVQYDIDITRLTTQLGTFVNLADPAVLRMQVIDGLRAQLQMESIVTGQLYVELSYRDDPPPAEFETRPTAWPEIPTTPSLLAALGTGAGSLVADVLRVLLRVNVMLEEVDMREINAAVVASAQAVQRLVDAPQIQAAIELAPGMTTQITRTMEQVQLLVEQIGTTLDPLQVNMESASSEMVLTMQALRRTVDETHGFLSTDSGLGYGLQQALVSLGEASEALRLLAASLERNPDMLLRGKRPDK